MSKTPFSIPVKPDGKAFLNCIKRLGTPSRTHFIELFLDAEILTEIGNRYDLFSTISSADPMAHCHKQIALQRFLGYDYVKATIENFGFKFDRLTVDGGKHNFAEEHRGPITNWEEYERYDWPDASKIETKTLEWYEKNLPDDMVVIGGLTGHIAEEITWLMGYETLCYTLYEDRPLVQAIYDKVFSVNKKTVELLTQFSRVKIIWASDDMGYKTGPLFSPADFKEFVFPAHKVLSEISHAADKMYFLHACGKLDLLMDDLIHDVKIDAKHSFEDTIEDVVETKKKYGSHMAMLGGIDVDFLCRSDESAIRARVRRTLEACQPGGGYCLGTGNSVANYIPVDNFLAMLDEGRRFSA